MPFDDHPSRFGPFPFDYGAPGWIHDLFLLVIVVVVIMGIYVLVRGVPRAPRSWTAEYWERKQHHRSHALDELDMRYARGEFDRLDYLQRRSDLLGAPADAHRETPPPTPRP